MIKKRFFSKIWKWSSLKKINFLKYYYYSLKTYIQINHKLLNTVFILPADYFVLSHNRKLNSILSFIVILNLVLHYNELLKRASFVFNHLMLLSLKSIIFLLIVCFNKI